MRGLRPPPRQRIATALSCPVAAPGRTGAMEPIYDPVRLRQSKLREFALQAAWIATVAETVADLADLLVDLPQTSRSFRISPCPGPGTSTPWQWLGRWSRRLAMRPPRICATASPPGSVRIPRTGRSFAWPSSIPGNRPPAAGLLTSRSVSARLRPSPPSPTSTTTRSAVGQRTKGAVHDCGPCSVLSPALVDDGVQGGRNQRWAGRHDCGCPRGVHGPPSCPPGSVVHPGLRALRPPHHDRVVGHRAAPWQSGRAARDPALH